MPTNTTSRVTYAVHDWSDIPETVCRPPALGYPHAPVMLGRPTYSRIVISDDDTAYLLAGRTVLAQTTNR